MRGGARVAPDRRPQDERDARRARAPSVGGGQRDAAREPGDHRAVAARCGEPRDAALARAEHGNGSSPRPAAAAVAHAAADQREDDVLALVQRGERADAERRRVVGDEQDRASHRSASS